MEDSEGRVWMLAVKDALALGMGVLVLRPDMSLERVGPEEYLDLAVAMESILDDRRNNPSVQ